MRVLIGIIICFFIGNSLYKYGPIAAQELLMESIGVTFFGYALYSIITFLKGLGE